jgi:hypothetical protein
MVGVGEESGFVTHISEIRQSVQVDMIDGLIDHEKLGCKRATAARVTVSIDEVEQQQRDY